MAIEYHEPTGELSPEIRDLHRAFTSLTEEVEAIDWYQQRIDTSGDEELREILAHNRDEEIEHAAMLIEWIRRRVPKFDEELGTYLHASGSIVAAEEKAESQENATEEPPAGSDLGIGSTRK